MKKIFYPLSKASAFILNTSLILFSLLLLLSCSVRPVRTNTISSSQERLKLDDSKGAYATKKYRNLFKENGHSEGEINNKINVAFEQLFYGDSAGQRIYFDAGRNAGGSMAYILDVYNNDIRSEGMSYGMMIAVQLDKKRNLMRCGITRRRICTPAIQHIRPKAISPGL